jgi:hypothetical protein
MLEELNADIKEQRRAMRKNQYRKTLTWASAIFGAFTAISVIGPIILDRIWKRSA